MVRSPRLLVDGVAGGRFVVALRAGGGRRRGAEERRAGAEVDGFIFGGGRILICFRLRVSCLSSSLFASSIDVRDLSSLCFASSIVLARSGGRMR